MKKSKNIGVLEFFRNRHDNFCLENFEYEKEARKILLEAKEPLDYREKLLSYYLSWKYSEGSNSNID